jgi:hypothetical protein
LAAGRPVKIVGSTRRMSSCASPMASPNTGSSPGTDTTAYATHTHTEQQQQQQHYESTVYSVRCLLPYLPMCLDVEASGDTMYGRSPCTTPSHTTHNKHTIPHHKASERRTPHTTETKMSEAAHLETHLHRRLDATQHRHDLRTRRHTQVSTL